MRKIFIGIFCLLTLAIHAQNKTANALTYKTAVGLRFWNGAGLNLKTFLKEKQAADVTAFLWKEGTLLTALYEYHGDLSTEGNLKWYGGGGFNVSFIKATKGTIVGLVGVIGVDYKFKNMPLNIALDWQPAVRFKTGYGYEGQLFGLDVRYTL